MNMRIFSSILLISTFIVGSTIFMSEEAPTKATWLWETGKIAEDTTAELLLKKKVNTLYLQIDPGMAPEPYAAFMKKMAALKIKVYALDGSPNWHNSKFDELYDWLEQYQQSYPQYAFAGIHLDVEPYLSDLWQQNEAQAIENYQRMMDYAYTRTKQAGLTFEVDIPFWFDERHYDNTFGQGNLAEWIIEKADGVTIMAYRDTPEEIIKASHKEITYGNKYDTPIIIGIETLQSDEGDFVSFAEEGERKMNRVLRAVEQAYKKEPMYGGMAIHHLFSWEEMGK